MKLKLKLNKRELTLVSVLGIVLFSFVYYKFLIVPQIAKAERISIEREQKRNELATFRTDMASQSKLEVELMKLKDKIEEESESYFLSLNQEEIIILINEFVKDTEVKLTAVNFEEPREEVLGEEVVEGEAPVEPPVKSSEDSESVKEDEETKINSDGDLIKSEEEKTSDIIDIHTVNLEYESEYYSLLDFIKNITSYQKKIMIKEISVNKDEEGKLKGSITLDFYVIGKIIKDEEFLDAWQPDVDGMVGNPFSEFSGYYDAKDAKKDESNPIATPTVTDKDSSKKNEETKPSNITKPNSNTSGSSGSGSDGISNTSDGKGNGDTGSSSGNNGSSGGSGSGNAGGNSGSVQEDKKPVSLNKTLVNFESMDNMFFIGNNKDILGTVQLNKDKKVEGNSSLSLKYDFVEKRQHNMANISFNNKAVIQTQPEGISLAIHPVQKNGGSVGIIIRDREGDEHKLKLTDDLNWDGWKTVSVDLPIEINYPAIVERIYVETFEFSEKLTGDMLLDDLKMIYDK